MKRKRHSGDYTHIILIGVLSLLFYLLQFTPWLSLRVAGARPVPLLPLLVAVSIFYGEWYGMTLGLILGMALDAVAAGASCFHALFFLFFGLVCGALSTYVLNRNLRAALTLSLGVSLVYFAARWARYLLPLHDPDALSYLLRRSLPGALYTALWIVPFFYFFRWLSCRRQPTSLL